jgi:hypothetical protein
MNDHTVVMLSEAKHLWLSPVQDRFGKRSEILRFAQNDSCEVVSRESQNASAYR